jgi:flagellar P-ring protein precursor FlgI
MDFLMKTLILFLILSFLSFSQSNKIESLTKIKGVKDIQLVGYGIVIGLDGTGDSKKSAFTMQSVSNMLERLGVQVPKKSVQVKNAAAVIVSSKISPFQNPGTQIDVTVSSLGDAKSLQGGVLLVSPLRDVHGNIYATAQGPISVGGFSVETSGGGEVKKNYTLVGRVPGGGIIQKQYAVNFVENDKITYFLKNPSFDSALKISGKINELLGENLSFVKNPGEVQLKITEAMQNNAILMPIINQIGNMTVEVLELPKIVVNERTGTIVIGKNVRIREVAISHGSLSIEVSSNVGVSQPGAFSDGETVAFNQTAASVNTEPARLLHVEQTTTVADIAKGLNQLGVTPRDLIAIFQALKEAGALEAELVIM